MVGRLLCGMADSMTFLVLVVVMSLVCVTWAVDNGALYLTPLLQQHRIQEAQNLSRVHGLSDEVESYSGYFTVDEQYDSNMFFWFFPAQHNTNQAPVVLWLNGGPGITSLMGVLVENGPLAITPSSTVIRRNVTWTEYFSMLYIDNPVGAGYSFTMNSSGLSTTMPEVVANLYSTLTQFFQVFPQYAQRDLYIGGQSYAGKYVPALGKYIHDRNHDTNNPPPVFLPLKGVYMGAGFCDAKTMLPVTPLSLYYVGLISAYERDVFFNETLDFIQQSLADGRASMEGWSHPNVDPKVEDLNNFVGLNRPHQWDLWFPLRTFMETETTRAALHVGRAMVVHDFKKVRSTLIPLDLFVDTNSENAFLMDHYKVLHYSGNLDLMVSVAMTEAFLKQVQWSGRERYLHSAWNTWRVDGEVQGWYTAIGNFSRVTLRNAGHYAPHDQPETSLLMMKNFVFDLPFDP